MPTLSRPARRSRHRAPRRPLVAVAAAVLLAPLLAVASPAGAATPAAPWFGLIAPTAAQLPSLAGGPVSHVVLGVGWDRAEPTPGGLDAGVVDTLRSAVADAQRRGLAVVLDLGLQYPPAWVFTLPGAPRFVDQYGDAWHSGLGQDVADPVFDPAVRQAEGSYLHRLGAALGPVGLAAIRVGGLANGELSYPTPSYGGHADALWCFGASARAVAPLPRWRPGTGTTAQATRMLGWYDRSLTGFLRWQLTTVARAFGRVPQQVMMPSWGLRPGMTAAAVAAGLHGTTAGEVNGEIAQGLDWVRQARAIRASGLPASLYSTWVDAPAQGTTVQQIPPVDYLARLAARFGLPLAGENAGGGGATALALTLQRARADHLTGVMYMSGGLLGSPLAGLDLAALQAIVAGLL